MPNQASTEKANTAPHETRGRRLVRSLSDCPPIFERQAIKACDDVEALNVKMPLALKNPFSDPVPPVPYSNSWFSVRIDAAFVLDFGDPRRELGGQVRAGGGVVRRLQPEAL
jgi:hypothetical protein